MNILRCCLPFCCLLLAAGCCRCEKSPETPNAPTAQIETEAMHAKRSAMLPISIEMNGTRDGDDTVISIAVNADGPLTAAPVLILTPDENTIMDAEKQIELTELLNASETVKKIRLSGNIQKLKAQVLLIGDGFGAEVHDAWPPEPVPKSQFADRRTLLPAPIEDNGQTITKGIRVTP